MGNRRIKEVVYQICSNCGKQYKESYGEYFSGELRCYSINSTNEVVKLEFQFCDECSNLLSDKTFSDIFYSLRDNKPIKS